MAIQDITKDGWNGNPRREVREGLQKKLIDLEASIKEKADLADFGHAKKVPYSLMPMVALANVRAITTLSPSADTVSANKLWYYSDGEKHHLFYRGSDGEDTSVGSPAYILYYSKDNPTGEYKVYRWKGNAFEAISELDESLLSGKASLDKKTSRLPYSVLPGMVLVSMGSRLDGMSVNLLGYRDRYFYDQVAGKLRYIDSSGKLLTCGDPVSDVIYCNQATSLLYRWDSIAGFVPVGGDPGSGTKDYITKEDIVDNVIQGGSDKVLSAEQGRQLMLRSHLVVEKVSGTELTLPAGRNEYWYLLYNEGGDSDNLVVWLSRAGTLAKEEHFAMSNGSVYYDIEKDRFLRYNTTTRRLSVVGGATGDIAEADGKAVSGGKVYAALQSLRANIDRLSDSENLSTVLARLQEIETLIDGLSDEESILGRISELSDDIAAKYSKPEGGIPASDLDESVQASLDKADTALQSDDLEGYAQKSEMSVTDGTGDDSDKTTIQLKEGTSATVLKDHQDISGKADLTGGLLAASQWPRTSIVNVGTLGNDVTLAVGDVIYNTGNGQLLLLTGPAEGAGSDFRGFAYIPIGAPQKNILYHCKSDRRFYTWDGSSFVQSLDVTGKAELALGGTVEMLAMSQWPRAVIKSITPGMSDVEGEVYYDEGMIIGDPIGLYVMTGNVRRFLGSPNPYTIYVAKDNGRLYRWDANDGVFVELGTPVDDTLDEDSDNAVSNKAVTTRLNETPMLVQHDRLPYSAMPRMILDSMDYDASQALLRPQAIYGKTVYCTDKKIRTGYSVNGINPHSWIYIAIAQDPVTGIVYWDKSTGRAYYWNGDGFTRLPISGSGGAAPAEQATIEVTLLGKGSFEEALSRASSNPSTYFQWILVEDSFIKVIWHIGDGVFIDANGTNITKQS